MAVGDRALVDRNPQLTFRANAAAGRHGWLRLTPAYGVRLVRDKVRDLPPGSVVTDPFSGTGTTPLAAAELGHVGQSVDVNPFLVWLGRAKTASYPLDVRDDVTAVSGSVVDLARHLVDDGDALWCPALHRIDRWWTPGALLGLAALRRGIDVESPEGPVRDLLDLAFCRTLIGVSNAAFNHQSMSFRSSPDEPAVSAPAVARATAGRFADEVSALVVDAGHGLPGRAAVRQGDSRVALRDFEPCDLLLTSPPYVNRMSYIRELRPYMYWLRFLDAPPDAGRLDWRAIGGTWGTATSKLHTWEPETPTPVDDVLTAVCTRIRESGGKNGSVLATYVHKYFHDMWHHFLVATAHVKPGGSVCYVVGNSSFYGNVVPAQEWYAEMMRSLGYRHVSVNTIRKRNSNKALFEYEVTATKP
ncbi:MAG: hypothetical protein QG622_1845 [Actinomycetota bacterium]|nr:hypothetical protein [Actinomycetota bacterium]